MHIYDSVVNIVKQAEESILFNNGILCTKKSKPEFHINMGAFHSAEACELLGILLLQRIRISFYIENFALFKVGGVILRIELITVLNITNYASISPPMQKCSIS